MKTLTRITSVILAVSLVLVLGACSKPTGETSSNVSVETKVESIVIDNTSAVTSEQTSNVQSTQSTQSQTSVSSEIVSTNISSEEVTSVQSEIEKENKNLSATPELTLCAQVADDIYVMGGICSKNTEYISISGAGVTPVKVNVAKGDKNNYFTTQVKVNFSTIVEIQAKETGKDLSGIVMRYVTTSSGMNNKMLQTDYKPVFGLNSQTHFYSAILTYTKSNILNDKEKEYVSNNISNTISVAKSVGAEVIYLVIPSSAAVYPETLPSEYKAATGETLYNAFNNIAKKSGATVLYPLDVMKSHKNDGDGYKIYSHTDSHWTTYGAYWGVNALMTHISAKYPSAKPRTVKEMDFYTTELFGGDALFSFNDGEGFENYSKAAATNGETRITRIKELTTLYRFKMPTDTLSKITRGKKSIYLTKDNEAAQTEVNSKGTGLPTAVVVRDSFGRTAYDMVNDRFSKVTWLAENDYANTITAIQENKPNYVIYIVSERNLLKVLHNSDVRLTDRF